MKLKSKLLPALLAMLITFCFSTKANAEEKEWTEVSTAQAFYDAINNDHGAWVKLTSDIDLSGLSADGNYLFDFTFTGKISGEKTSKTQYRTFGLKNWKHIIFNTLDHAEIIHLSIIDCSFDGQDTQSGQLCEYCENTTFDDLVFSGVSATGDVTGYDCDRMGDVAGKAKDCNFYNIVFLDCTMITDGSELGLVVGEASGCKFKYCVTNAGCEVWVDGNTDNAYAGGICGKATDCYVDSCFNFATVTSDDDRMGGIIGYGNNTTIINCKNGGVVKHTTKKGFGREEIAKHAKNLAITGAVFALSSYLSYALLTRGASSIYVYAADNAATQQPGFLPQLIVRAGFGRMGLEVVHPIFNMTFSVLATGLVSCMPEVFAVVAVVALTTAGSLALYNLLADPDEVGGIVGTVENGSTILQCVNGGPVECSDNCCGGIVGKCCGSTVTSCYNRSFVRGTGANTGGIVGYCDGSTVTGCLNVAPVTSKGSNLGYIVGGTENTVTCENNYYLGEENADNGSSGIVFTQEKLPSGEISQLLNSKLTNPCWHQELGTDFYPSLHTKTPINTKTTTEYSLVQKIRTSEDFFLASANPNAQMSIENDIDLGNYYFNLSSKDHPFKGTIKGNNHTISNLSYEMSDDNSDNNYAMFPYVKNATFQDLTLDNIKVTQADEVNCKINTVGILAATSTNTDYYNVRLKNCSVTINSDEDYLSTVAGIAANSTGDNFENCTVESTCEFSGYSGINCTPTRVGGICAYAYSGTFKWCRNSATIWADDDDEGGILGRGQYCTIWRCLNTGTITGQEYVGGIAGHVSDETTIEDCVNTGTIKNDEDKGEKYHGGIVGSIDGSGSEVAYCLNFGTIVNVGDNCGKIDGAHQNSAVYGDGNYWHCQYDGNSEDNGSSHNIDYENDILTGKYAYEHSGFYQSLDNIPFCTKFPVPVSEAGIVYQNTLCDDGQTLSYSNYYKGQAGHTCEDYAGVCSICGRSTSVPEEITISNATELNKFAHAVNSGVDYSNSKVSLTSDIDLKGVDFVPVGIDESHPFRGSFNGNCHHIKNLNLSRENGYTGFFGCVSSANGKYTYIDQLVVDTTCTFSSDCQEGVAGIAGCVATPSGTTTDVHVVFQACSNMADVTGKINAAGIVGGVYYNDNIHLTLFDCINTGTITGSSESAALVGYGRKNLLISNCVNYGSVTGYDKDHSMIRYSYSDATSTKFENIYQLEDLANETNAETKTSQEFSNGSLCYALTSPNRYQYNHTIWGENLGNDYYPNITLDGIHHSRTMKNQWGSLMLPYQVWSDADIQYYKVASCNINNNDEGSLVLKPVNSIDANTPCFFRKLDSKATGIDITKTEGESFALPDADDEGLVIKETEADKWYIVGASLDYPYFIGGYYVANDKMWYANSINTPAYLPAYRSGLFYTGPTECKALKISVSEADGSETGIGEIANGNVMFYDNIYSLSGQRLSETQKGHINIINGKKVFVK